MAQPHGKFGRKIRLSKCSIGEREKEAVLHVLEEEFLGMGSEVRLFEESLSNFFNRSAVCVASGTAALHLALEACDIGDGDEVLVPSLTYVASFQAISQCGATPIPVDVFSDSLSMDWHDAERAIPERTRAIMPMHYGGGIRELDKLYEIANKYNLRVIEDAAHAFGSSVNGRRVGSFGDIACFSFDGIKNITSGEGGCIVTTDKIVLQRVSDSRLLGVVKDTANRYQGKRSWEFDVVRRGWRYHMSNIMAAIGRIQLERFEELSKKRQELAKQYDSLLLGEKSIELITRNYEQIVPHIYPILLINPTYRDLIRTRLLEIGIETGIHYYPNHWLTYYQKNRNMKLVNTDLAYTRLLTLPLHPDLSKEEVGEIVKILLKLLKDVDRGY